VDAIWNLLAPFSLPFVVAYVALTAARIVLAFVRTFARSKRVRDGAEWSLRELNRSRLPQLGRAPDKPAE
jgi:hypothetical protein